jgi:hypothetical protein
MFDLITKGVLRDYCRTDIVAMNHRQGSLRARKVWIRRFERKRLAGLAIFSTECSV